MAGASIDEVFLCTVGKQGPTLLGRRVPIFVSHDDVFFGTLQEKIQVSTEILLTDHLRERGLASNPLFIIPSF